MDESKIAFMLAVTRQGPMWLNQFDYDPQKPEHGVGVELKRDGERFKGIGVLVCKFAAHRRTLHGDGVVIMDGGANIGTFTIPWALFMTGWGKVISFEPQKWPFMQLCANVVTNNCYNADPRRQALSHSCGSIPCPEIHPLIPHNAGGIHMGQGDELVPMVSIDSLDLDRLDIMKLDVEGMEPDALAGAKKTIERCKPIIVAEAALCGSDRIMDALPDYAIIGAVDAVCIPMLQENEAMIKMMVELAKHWKEAGVI